MELLIFLFAYVFIGMNVSLIFGNPLMVILWPVMVFVYGLYKIGTAIQIYVSRKLRRRK